MKKTRNYLAGYSLPELLLVLSILGVLFSISTINLFGSYHKNTLNTTVATFISDLKHQQTKAMAGDNEGQSNNDDYGTYFPPDGLSYILFKGSTYDPAEPTNFQVRLNGDLQFSSILVPGSEIIFAQGNGEILNYNAGFDNITVRNIRTDETKTIRINQVGTIINIY
ncbi:hypothetical protein A2774_01820 [Candidatus Roizmanbacteria bacterium RIFCSPHIGHO2_01_FULL_39_12c]|uniref:General secretion pathway GspH domain-containing protein n=1 Tax=Candidatus Roizmanbacteria bacterium RIFCSPHIGHO2_01_FULL_39_12c TaxID=1802031 RepID=A0A1F7GB04_9BACT|nr:MAG: hypothetical protein A2774_01820 [Candidatus Roizmanbacteria bacterium RIFCSPHIGHO2_01_FULL_39_12c]OGK46930.1 MAG: hypothetical protein A2963_05230 [Candidatus Roizmanbacteria bacterium RIFCSPLOWO2_01_FULL_40_13]